jgi:hypothetical protein
VRFEWEKSFGFAPAMRAKISRPIASTSDCIF